MYPTEIAVGQQVRVQGDTLIVEEIQEIGSRRRFRFHDGSSAQFVSSDRVFLPEEGEKLQAA
jgi:hypothetical protein